VSRFWSEFVAAVGDVVSLPLVLLLLFAATALIAVLWYTFPAWVPRRNPFARFRLRRSATGEKRARRKLRIRLPHWRLPRLRWPRLRWPWRRKPKVATVKTVEEQIAEVLAAEEELPSVPVTIYQSLADRLAAEGRYAEALRERYRAAVRDLVQHGVIDNRPGWTVTELARAAAVARPAVDAPLTSATGLFSEVWYAERPATVQHDERMRDLAGDVHAHLGSTR
jgi:Domain of unknown function (DUF4129)